LFGSRRGRGLDRSCAGVQTDDCVAARGEGERQGGMATAGVEDIATDLAVVD